MKRILLILVLVLSLVLPTCFAETQTTIDQIYNFFESQGVSIKIENGNPLITQSGALWLITLEDGQKIIGDITDGKITYCLGGKEFNDIPLDDPSAASKSTFDLESMTYWELYDLQQSLNYEFFKRDINSGTQIYQGTYIVGEDFPAGTYRVKSLSMAYSSVLTVYNSEGKMIDSYAVSYESPIGKLALHDGEMVKITFDPVTFYTYMGIAF